jgi:hypothetical protein
VDLRVVLRMVARSREVMGAIPTLVGYIVESCKTFVNVNLNEEHLITHDVTVPGRASASGGIPITDFQVYSGSEPGRRGD